MTVENNEFFNYYRVYDYEKLDLSGIINNPYLYQTDKYELYKT